MTRQIGRTNWLPASSAPRSWLTPSWRICWHRDGRRALTTRWRMSLCVRLVPSEYRNVWIVSLFGRGCASAHLPASAPVRQNLAKASSCPGGRLLAHRRTSAVDERALRARQPSPTDVADTASRSCAVAWAADLAEQAGTLTETCLRQLGDRRPGR